MARPGRWTLLHLGSLGLVLAFVVYCARGQWFFGDEWDFLVFRGIRGTHLLGLWAPHNEHWSTIPILLWRAVFHFVGIGSYWPYMGLLFAAHLLAVHFLWRILKRLPHVSPALAVAGAAVLGLYGAGWEDLLWAFQIGFVGSLAFGLGLVAAIDEHGSTNRVAAVSVGAVLSLMMSGISVVMLGVVGLTALGKWGWRKALEVTVPAGAVYAFWFTRYGQPSIDAQDQLHGTLSDIPRYVVGGVGGTLGEFVGQRSIGTYLLIALGAVTVWFLRRWIRTAPEALAMAAGGVALYVVISQGRGALPQPATSRYLYLSAGLLIPIVVVAIAEATKRWKGAQIIAVVATLAVVVVGARGLERESQVQRRIDLANRGQFIAAEQLAASGIHLVSDQPQSPFAPDLKIADLVSLRQRNKSFTQPVNARDEAGARLALQVGSTEREPTDRTLGDTRVTKLPQFSLRPTGKGCMRIDAHGGNVEVQMGGRSAFSITSPNAGIVQLFVPYEGGYAGPRYVGLKPGVTTTLVSDLVGPMVVQLLPGVSEMCGITWQ
ncbi:MAG: hypothetical protein Q8K63_06045 [Acidimicrobiales bacterium]|nr:hypothetical protein [Acidimicrobiales bacterium]